MRGRLSGLNLSPKLGNTRSVLVEEQCVEAEAVAEAAVDETQERMPA